MCTTGIWTAILAWLQFVIYLIGVIAAGYAIHQEESLSGQISSMFEERYVSILDIRIEQSSFYLMILIYCLIGLLATLLLIISLSQKSPLLAVPWLVNTMFFIAVTIFLSTRPGASPILIISGIVFIIWVIGLVAVKSFKKDIRTNENVPPNVGMETLPYIRFDNTVLQC